MNYEKAWDELKWHLTQAMLHSHHFAESEKRDADERLKAQGGDIIARVTLCYMSKIEKEMTTAGEDDGQKVQD